MSDAAAELYEQYGRTRGLLEVTKSEWDRIAFLCAQSGVQRVPAWPGDGDRLFGRVVHIIEPDLTPLSA